MIHKIRPAEDRDATGIVAVFNHFVLNSFAAYPSEPVDESFARRIKEMAGKYPVYVIETDDKVIGFALIRPYHFADTLQRSAEATIFILPEYTHAGIGSKVLAQLEDDARQLGIDTLLGSASSLNEQSLRFQKKNGFAEVGRFQRVGRKFDRDYDIIWMQKFL